MFFFQELSCFNLIWIVLRDHGVNHWRKNLWIFLDNERLASGLNLHRNQDT